jgi:hypothetical protein
MKYAKPITILSFIVGSIVLLPHAYRCYVTHKLTKELDEKHGKTGWVASGLSADAQGGEQINLYRTVYFKLLHPKFISLTPYKNLTFTHKTMYAHTPPHYAVMIETPNHSYSYRWSMKKNSWYITSDSSHDNYPDWIMTDITSNLRNQKRRSGLNRPRTKSIQQVDPTVKTPVESGNEHGTAKTPVDSV